MIDYKKRFEKLVEQIKQEARWGEEASKANPRPGAFINEGVRPTITECLEHERKQAKFTYYNGMKFAYRSIENLAIKLEEGEFDDLGD